MLVTSVRDHLRTRETTGTGHRKVFGVGLNDFGVTAVDVGSRSRKFVPSINVCSFNFVHPNQRGSCDTEWDKINGIIVAKWGTIPIKLHCASFANFDVFFSEKKYKLYLKCIDYKILKLSPYFGFVIGFVNQISFKLLRLSRHNSSLCDHSSLNQRQHRNTPARLASHKEHAGAADGGTSVAETAIREWQTVVRQMFCVRRALLANIIICRLC